MGIFKPKLNESEQSFLASCSSALMEIQLLDVEMIANPKATTAEAMIKSGNNFSVLVAANRPNILNFSVHNKKEFAQVILIGSEIRSLRDKGIHYLDVSTLNTFAEAKKPSIEWELTVIQRILGVSPISFFSGDQGYRANIITEMLTNKEWDLLRAEYSSTGTISFKSWKSIRDTCKSRYEENKYQWVFGEGTEYV